MKLLRRYHFHFIDFSVTILASSTHYNVCVEICYQLYCVVCDTQHQTTQYTKHKRENQVERREATKKELERKKTFHNAISSHVQAFFLEEYEASEQFIKMTQNNFYHLFLWHAKKREKFDGNISRISFLSFTALSDHSGCDLNSFLNAHFYERVCAWAHSMLSNCCRVLCHFSLTLIPFIPLETPSSLQHTHFTFYGDLYHKDFIF